MAVTTPIEHIPPPSGKEVDQLRKSDQLTTAPSVRKVAPTADSSSDISLQRDPTPQQKQSGRAIKKSEAFVLTEHVAANLASAEDMLKQIKDAVGQKKSEDEIAARVNQDTTEKPAEAPSSKATSASRATINQQMEQLHAEQIKETHNIEIARAERIHAAAYENNSALPSTTGVQSKTLVEQDEARHAARIQKQNAAAQQEVQRLKESAQNAQKDAEPREDPEQRRVAPEKMVGGGPRTLVSLLRDLRQHLEANKSPDPAADSPKDPTQSDGATKRTNTTAINEEAAVPLSTETLMAKDTSTATHIEATAADTMEHFVNILSNGNSIAGLVPKHSAFTDLLETTIQQVSEQRRQVKEIQQRYQSEHDNTPVAAAVVDDSPAPIDKRTAERLATRLADREKAPELKFAQKAPAPDAVAQLLT